MAPQTPLLLWDNVFDTVTLYPGATLTGSGELTGRDYFRIADARRERSWWQPAVAGADHYIRVDLGVGATRVVDYLALDRGHNLWGKSVIVHGGPDGIVWDQQTDVTIPAQGTLGGSPVHPSVAVTEEGACYMLINPAKAARRYWQFVIPAVVSFTPVITGLWLGSRTQLPGFSRVYDEDAGERTEMSERSRAGYRGTDTTYSWRTAILDLAMIGATDYDNTIRTLRDRLFHRNAPVWIAMDYDTYPARMWLYQYEGRTWGMPKTRVHRGGPMRFVEIGHSLT